MNGSFQSPKSDDHPSDQNHVSEESVLNQFCRLRISTCTFPIQNKGLNLNGIDRATSPPPDSESNSATAAEAHLLMGLLSPSPRDHYQNSNNGNSHLLSPGAGYRPSYQTHGSQYQYQPQSCPASPYLCMSPTTATGIHSLNLVNDVSKSGQNNYDLVLIDEMSDDTDFDFNCPSLSLLISSNEYKFISDGGTAKSETHDNNNANTTVNTKNVVPPSPRTQSLPFPNSYNNKLPPVTATISNKEHKNSKNKNMFGIDGTIDIASLLQRQLKPSSSSSSTNKETLDTHPHTKNPTTKTQQQQKWKDVDTIAKDMADNIRTTFGYVVNARAQTWMDAIQKTLDREKERSSAGNAATENTNHTLRNESGDVLDKQGEEVKPEDNSKTKVFKALQGVSSKLSVTKVKTTFRLNKKCLNMNSPHSTTAYPTTPTLKDNVVSSSNLVNKKKVEVKPDGQQNDQTIDAKIVSPPPKRKPISKSNKEDTTSLYEVKRAIDFTATIEISSPYDLTLFLHAPGSITGVFESYASTTFTDCLMDDENTKTGDNSSMEIDSGSKQQNVFSKSRFKSAKVKFDMDSLVNSIRKQSRYVARRAAEIELTASSTNGYTQHHKGGYYHQSCSATSSKSTILPMVPPLSSSSSNNVTSSLVSSPKFTATNRSAKKHHLDHDTLSSASNNISVPYPGTPTNPSPRHTNNNDRPDNTSGDMPPPPPRLTLISPAQKRHYLNSQKPVTTTIENNSSIAMPNLQLPICTSSSHSYRQQQQPVSNSSSSGSDNDELLEYQQSSNRNNISSRPHKKRFKTPFVPTSASSEGKVDVHNKNNEKERSSHQSQQRSSDGSGNTGPSLPVLVEVACASFEAEEQKKLLNPGQQHVTDHHNHSPKTQLSTIA